MKYIKQFIVGIALILITASAVTVNGQARTPYMPSQAEEKITVDQTDQTLVDEQKDVKIEVTNTVTQSITTDIETIQKEIAQLETIKVRMEEQLGQVNNEITKRNELITKIQNAIESAK